MIRRKPDNVIDVCKGCDITSGTEKDFVLFANDGSSVVCACAYPADGVGAYEGCSKAVSLSVGCFLERPSVKDVALETIELMMSDEIISMSSENKRCACSFSSIFVNRGKARPYTRGYSAVAYYEERKCAGVWFGDGRLLGSGRDYVSPLHDAFELNTDSAFALVSAAGRDVIDRVGNCLNNDTCPNEEQFVDLVREMKCSYAFFNLPKKEKRFFR